MCKKIEHYKYKRVSRGWVAINCKTGGHSHFRSEFGCKVIIKFLLEGTFPDNPYLQESYKRLADHTTRKKQKYINKGLKYG